MSGRREPGERHAEGVAAILRLIAHELRNPLHRVALAANAVGRSTDTSTRAHSAEINAAVSEMSELLDEYLELGAPDRCCRPLEPIDVRAPVERAILRHRPTLDERRINVSLRLADAPLIVAAEANHISEVVHTLVLNAVEALQEHGLIEITVHEDGDHAAIVVRDDGPGFKDPRCVFRPFYSTKPGRAGLGLSIVRDLVRAHRGEVHAHNPEQGGASVSVRLPLVNTA